MLSDIEQDMIFQAASNGNDRVGLSAVIRRFRSDLFAPESSSGRLDGLCYLLPNNFEGTFLLPAKCKKGLSSIWVTRVCETLAKFNPLKWQSRDTLYGP